MFQHLFVTLRLSYVDWHLFSLISSVSAELDWKQWASDVSRLIVDVPFHVCFDLSVVNQSVERCVDWIGEGLKGKLESAMTMTCVDGLLSWRCSTSARHFQKNESHYQAHLGSRLRFRRKCKKETRPYSRHHAHWWLYPARTEQPVQLASCASAFSDCVV